MGMLDSRVARLEIAINGGARVHVLSIGAARDDAAQAVAQLMPDAKPADIVVILRRFTNSDAPPQLVHGGQ